MVAQRTRAYELVMILTPEATEEEINKVLERTSTFVTEHGGAVTAKDVWGLRRLAYPIKKFMEGNFVLTKFTLDATATAELNRILRLNDGILRFLITSDSPNKAVNKASKAKAEKAAKAAAAVKA